jgi:hypothetical protein
MTGNTYQTGSHYLTGDVILSGSINIGDNLTGDTINFGGEVNSNILPTTGATYDLGSSGKTWDNVWAENAHFTNISIGDITLDSLALPGDLTVSGTTTLSGSVFVEDLTEKRLVVVGTNGELVDYSGLTFDNGNLNVSGAIEVTNIQGTGSLYLKPDLNDSRDFRIYNTGGPSDIHIKGNAAYSFFGDDTNYLKIDDNTSGITINAVDEISINSNDITVTGSLYNDQLTNDRIVIVGTDGLLEDDANFTFDGSVLNVGQGNVEIDIDGDIRTSGSLKVDNGLTVSGNTILYSDLYVSGNIEFYGSATNVHISSSQVEIGDNIILLNAYSPFERYAGMALYDSGSTGESGSFLWDSLNNYFLLNNNGSTSKVIGTTTSSLGNENSLTDTYFPIATGDNTIGNSLLRYSGTTLSFNTNKFTVDSSSGDVYVGGNVRINGAGGSNYTGYTSEIVFKNSDDDLGFVSGTDTQTVTTQLLGYQSSDGTLVFSSLIDGGSY